MIPNAVDMADCGVPQRPSTHVRARVRAYKPKVVTGCITCKIRRIKCDEGKPSCKRCTTTGRTCDGYISPKDLVRSGPKRRDTSSPYPSASPSLIPSPSIEIPGSEQERHCFDFFRKETVTQLCGVFDAVFWRQLVLQASHREPAIRHAAIALGSLHEKFELGDGSNEHDGETGFALQQYLKAISLLVQPVKESRAQSADVALISCVMFVGFEILRGHIGAAFSHIYGGVKIIRELLSKSKSVNGLRMPATPYVPLNNLLQVFIRLDTQPNHVAADRTRKLVFDRTTTKPGGSEDPGNKMKPIPRCFSSLEEARNAKVEVWAQCVRAVQNLNRPISTSALSAFYLSVSLVRKSTSERLKQWSTAFENYIRTHQHEFNSVTQQTVHVLKLHKIMMDIFFSMDHVAAQNDETLMDCYIPESEAMLQHAEAVVKLSMKPSQTSKPKAHFSLDTGIVFPLFCIATKCRHAAIRRRAISILYSTSRQEGVMNSFMTAMIAERVVEIEEDGLDNPEFPEDVPNWKRIAGIDMDFDIEGRVATLRYLKWKGPNTSRRESVVELIDPFSVAAKVPRRRSCPIDFDLSRGWGHAPLKPLQV